MLSRMGKINMKMRAFLSAKSEYVRDFKPNRNIPLMERMRICSLLIHRLSSPLKETISMEDLYYIVGHFDEKSISQHPDNKNQHPVDTKEVDIGYHKPAHENVFDLDSYIKRIEKKITEGGFENHITVEREPKSVLISEKDKDYRPKCKITIKNLIINAHDQRRAMFFYSPTSPSDSASGKDGIYLIFENNRFIGKPYQGSADFHPEEGAYFIFKNNIFISVNMFLSPGQVPKIELKGNIFMDSNVEIPVIDSNRFTRDNIICLEDNIFYRRDEGSSILKVGIDCYFKGKNTVDNLVLNLKSLHWGGYQNIDPQGNHAYMHRKMFIDFMEKAVEKNDKMQETRLRRELMKCERVLFRKEKKWHSLQDRFILGWSRLFSDYGNSWLRPVLWLLAINAFFAIWVFSILVFSFEHTPSLELFFLLFFKFFHPLNNLSNVEGINGNVWISLIAVLQKGFFAVCLYETIKIFRRFSPK